MERLWEPGMGERAAPRSEAKTPLREWAGGGGLPLPAYELVATSGPDHAPHFTVAVRVAGQAEASATASSKRAAKTAAPAALLEQMNADKEYPATTLSRLAEDGDPLTAASAQEGSRPRVLP